MGRTVLTPDSGTGRPTGACRTGRRGGPVTDGRSRRREDTRQRLFVAAVELIAEQGFSATSVDDIAARAGVAKGTVYYNFESKTVLFEELLRHGIGLLTADFRAAVAGLPPREALAALVRTELEYIRRYRAFAQLLLSEMWRTNREWQQTLRLLRGEAIEVIAETVRAGVASGDLPADLDVRTASSALFGVGLVVAVDWLVFQPDRPIEDVQEALLGIVRRVAQT
ncbi:TetR family transcriptional regulator [Micromonospora globispora]|uniref:TetR family transcriptional regulator n=1 Tax=Micromonospora globispora TaxID=1450148 RepID=A0A317KE35_9ACTN|nr:TetR family transcriptional regulator [Micromonospora globispora]PWU62001.1 TetR family transcriptional regulator [Micromonospora globispora]